ncbi:MAG: GNAT family N-acetyltransferase [Kiloniellaceae bacterium]
MSSIGKLPRQEDSKLRLGASEITLRQARPDDIPAIDALHFLSVQALGAADYSPAEIEAFLGYLGTYDPALIDDGTYFVLEQAGRLVGSGGWSQRLPRAAGAEDGGRAAAQPFSLSPHSAKIRSIFVHPNYARLGLGSRLVQHAEAEAVAAGFQLLELWASLTGVPLYRKLGYQSLARMALPCANGAAVPAVHMAKLVPAVIAGVSAA